MPKSVLDEPRFRNEEAAYAYVEAIVWPSGRVCPHCGVVDRSSPMKGKSTRIGTYKCYACRKPFTVKIGTIFEKSHVPMHIWLQAMHLMCSSKKGFSANQFCRVLGVDFKTGWFIGHRIREAMAEHGDVFGPIGGEGKTIEIDETFWGRKEGAEQVDPGNSIASAVGGRVVRVGPVALAPKSLLSLSLSAVGKPVRSKPRTLPRASCAGSCSPMPIPVAT